MSEEASLLERASEFVWTGILCDAPRREWKECALEGKKIIGELTDAIDRLREMIDGHHDCCYLNEKMNEIFGERKP